MKNENSPESPQLSIDDDWKAQVQKEKEKLEREERQKSTPSSSMPPPTFSMLVNTFAAQTISALGFVPNPLTGKAEVDRGLAKHSIDLLSMLEDKTRGNLTEEEAELLKETLHQLRLAFVMPLPPTGAGGDSPPPTKPIIELP